MDLLRGTYDFICAIILQQQVADAISLATRWLHILSAGCWLGLAVLGALALRGDEAPASPQPLARAFNLYRYASLIALLSGINLLHIYYRFPVKN
jgi:hypothetical protein